jgi:CHAD domain-containing protein
LAISRGWYPPGVKSGVEREVKLRPGPRFRGIELDGRPIEGRTLTSVYHDTGDLRLAQAGITLRLRFRDSGAAWQLKLPRGAARSELEWPAPHRRVPGEIRGLLLAHTRGRPLDAVATLRTQRSGVVATAGGKDLAEVVQDRVEVIAEDRVVDAFEEIEVELVDGDPDDLERLEQLLLDAGARKSDAPPKVFRALGKVPSRHAPARAKGRRRRVLARALAEQYAELLDRDPGTRLAADPEALHDHRSAVRRLRALLRAGRPLLDRAWADDLRRSLKRVGRALAEARDLDVLIARVEEDRNRLSGRERTGAGDVLDALRERRLRLQAEIVASLSEPWYVSTLNRLEAAVADPHFAGSGSLRRGVRREHRRARKVARSLSERSADAELHALRRAVRNGRYAAELAEAGGVRRARRYRKRAKALQSTLGEHQDAVVAAALLAEIDQGLTRPSAHQACAALAGMQAERRAAARARVERGWKRLEARAV